MIGLFKRQRNHQRSAGLALRDDGIALVVLEGQTHSATQSATGQSKLRLCTALYEPLPNAAARPALIRQLAREHQLDKARLRVVLAPEQYNLLQMEAPSVGADELVSAVRWSIKDMIDFHIDDALIDVFELPRPNSQGKPLLLSVVAARKALIGELLQQLREVELDPDSIDITELALRNLGASCGDGDHSTASLFLLPQQSFIEITRAHTLFLARRLDVTANSLLDEQPAQHDNTAFADAWQADSPYDALGLELQRSLDHFESHFGLGGARQLNVLHGAANSHALTDYLQQSLNVSVQGIDLDALLPGAGELDAAALGACLPAIGAAMRH